MTLPGFEGIAYPASTGIGTCSRDIVMSCIAMSTSRDDVEGWCKRKRECCRLWRLPSSAAR